MLRWNLRSVSAFGALALLVSGCGGGNASVDNAIVVPDPTVKVGAPTGGAAAPTKTAEAGGTAAAPAATADASKPAAPTTPVKAEGWGTLKGKITLEGAAPSFPDNVITKDPEVCGKGSTKSDKLVVDAASKGVKNVIVYINRPTAVNPEAKSAITSAKEVVFDQKNCIFEPHVLAMMVGQKVELKSSDAVSHNINSKVDNNPLNQAMAANGSSPFSPAAAARQPGLVVCDIHPWMTAYWLVLDHPYFAVTNEKGEFEIKNVPAGTQKVVVWQESARYVTPTAGKEVNVAANGTTTEDFKLDAAKLK